MIRHAVKTLRPFRSFFLQIVRTLAAGVGLVAAGFGESVRLLGLELPCRSTVCGDLSRDPLNAFPPFTPGAAGIALFGFVLVATIVPNSRRHAQATNLSVTGAFGAMGLVAYTRLRYGDFCPWCLLIASCVAVVALTYVVVDDEPAPMRPVPTIAALLLSVAAVGLLVRTEASVGVDRFALSLMPPATVAPRASWIGDGQPETVLFVDFGCSACRSELERRLRTRRPFAVRSVGRGEYDRAAAEYLAAHPSPAEKPGALARLLVEPSQIAAGVAHLPPPPGPRRPDLVKADAALARRLRITATPTVLQFSEGRFRLASGT